jgi:hypothetical protein
MQCGRAPVKRKARFARGSVLEMEMRAPVFFLLSLVSLAATGCGGAHLPPPGPPPEYEQSPLPSASAKPEASASAKPEASAADAGAR